MNLIPTSIELHISMSTLKPGHVRQIKDLGGKASRVSSGDTCRIVEIPCRDATSWKLADEIMRSYPLRRGTCAIFRGCDDAGVSATVVQYVREGGRATRYPLRPVLCSNCYQTDTGDEMKRHRPRNRKPYRDNVLTVPATPDRFQLEERRIREAWRRTQPQLQDTALEPRETTQVIELDTIKDN